MSLFEFRLTLLLIALLATALLTGAGWYEQAVLDTVWPARPDIVRPAQGGASRKRFWVPANILAVATLLPALWVAWPILSVRYAVLAAVACSIAINIATIRFFGPRVLTVERHGVAPNDPSSLRWVRLSRWRTPAALTLNVALIVGVHNLVLSQVHQNVG
jgi:hypothetical protein